jgi:hypothetical protein
MNARLIELAERRAVLVSRTASQRADLAQILAPWRGPLAVVDQGVSVLRYLGRHPVLLAGVVAGAAVLRPRRVFGWLRGGWPAWRVVVAVRRKLSGSAR